MKKIFCSISIIIGILALQYCSDNLFSRLRRDGRNTSEHNHWEQPDKPGQFSPEIVFVMDTSGSLGVERASLVSALEGWLEHLNDQGIKDFCLGVMGGYVGNKSGRYQAASENPHCACTSDYSITEIKNIFVENLASLDSEDISDGGEAFLYSFYRAISNSDAISENQSNGCLLREYTLVPIFLSDEGDASSAVDGANVAQSGSCNGMTVDIGNISYDVDTLEFDNGSFPNIDPTYSTSNSNSVSYNPVDTECQEASARFKYYSEHTLNADGKYNLKITPSVIANKLKTYNGIFPSFGTGVGYLAGPNKFPAGGENGPMWGGIEFAGIFGETIADLSKANSSTQNEFEEQLGTVADHLAKKVSFFYVFDLIEPVCGDKLNSLKVEVNGTQIDSSSYELNEDLDRVTFSPDYDFDYGDSIDIFYTKC